MLGRYLDSGEVRDLLQVEFRKIFAIGVTVKWRVEIGAGICHHLDLADLKLGSWGVVLPRGFAAQVVADDRGGQAFVGYEAVLDGVTQIDQFAGSSHGGGNHSVTLTQNSIPLTNVLVYIIIYNLPRNPKPVRHRPSPGVPLP